MRLALTFFYLLAFLSWKLSAQRETDAYSFSQPASIIYLPDTLREISDLCLIDSTSFACVQDENGIIFIYDFLKKEIVHQYMFHTNGDYEGIALTPQYYYVLRSDGLLFEKSRAKKSGKETEVYLTGIPAADNEGLCYDKVKQRLLIACKSKVFPEYGQPNKRYIYGFDLKTKKLQTAPAFVFDVEQTKTFARLKGLSLPEKPVKGKKPAVAQSLLRFAMSAIAIHPLSGHLYVVSAEDYALMVYDRAGVLIDMIFLDPKICYKTEGISFFKNGDLLLSNEAQGAKANVVLFKYQP